MQSFLIVGKDREKIKEKSSEILEKRKVGKWDTSLFEFEKSIGIEDFRKIKENIFLKPIKSPEKAIILDVFNGITLEAQQSMLKILEEPPQNTIIILLAESKNPFLPTVISRCQIIEIPSESLSDGNVEKILDELFSSDVGEKFYLAQKLSEDREKAIAWIESALFEIRKKMLNQKKNSDLKKNSKLLREFIETHRLLKNTNVNSRLTLENLFLNI
ncbi:MAG: hypothetical protein HYV38_02960 [Candidatus Levybacteria bacterium]|nr:hypothetical protein [Candidatus Levybacteria bacterium]